MSTPKFDKTQCIGITETSDPCFHLDLFDNLYNANIIITKNLTSKLIEKLVEHKDKCILHLTVTGMGGSKIEPFVPEPMKMLDAVNTLISELTSLIFFSYSSDCQERLYMTEMASTTIS